MQIIIIYDEEKNETYNDGEILAASIRHCIGESPIIDFDETGGDILDIKEFNE